MVHRPAGTSSRHRRWVGGRARRRGRTSWRR